MKKSTIVIWIIVVLLVLAGTAVLAYHMGKSSQCEMNVSEPSATPIVTSTSVTSSADPKATATSAPTADFKGEISVGGIQYDAAKDVYIIMGMEAINNIGEGYSFGDVKSVILKPTDKVTDFDGSRVTMESFFKNECKSKESVYGDYYYSLDTKIIFDVTDQSFAYMEGNW